MDAIELTIPGREKDLGGFTVHRILPHARRRMVGPFIFLDHLGPAMLGTGQGMDVRPHPHIGLSTVTYLYDGEIIHRDSVGSVQAITPGAVNWMTAGCGIAHSERTGVEERSRPHSLHGLQSWVALPKSHEEMAPEFHHHPADSLPRFTLGPAEVTLIAGRAFGHEAPVKLFSPLFYLDFRLPAGATLVLPADRAERALYLVAGRLRIGQSVIEARNLPVFTPGTTLTLEAERDAHFVLFGGDPLAEPRFIWWNFVSSSADRLAAAKEDWKNQRFPPVADDSGPIIPLPE